MSDLIFYQTRRDEMRQAAADATLDNVRDRCQRAADAFAQLADRAERTEQTRDEERLRRAESGLTSS